MTNEQYEALVELITSESQEVRAQLQCLREDLQGVRAEVDELRGGGEERHGESRNLPCYGDFPELFPGLPPDEAIDLHDDRATAKLFVRADPEAYRRLIPPESARKRARRLVGERASWALLEVLCHVDSGETNPGA